MAVVAGVASLCRLGDDSTQGLLGNLSLNSLAVDTLVLPAHGREVELLPSRSRLVLDPDPVSLGENVDA